MVVLEFILPKNPSLDSTYSWFVIICSCLYCGFGSAFYMASGTLYVIIQERYGVSKQRATYPMNTFVTVGFILSCFCGPIHHRLKTRKTLILASVLGTLGSCLSVFDPTNDPIVWLSICMAITGMGSSLVIPSIYQVTATHFKKHRAKAFMILSVNTTLGGLVLPSIVAGSVEEYGLESSWFIQAAIHCQTLLLALIIRPLPTLRQLRNDQEPISIDQLPKRLLEAESETEESKNMINLVTPSPMVKVDQSKSAKRKPRDTDEKNFRIVLFNLFRDKTFYPICASIVIAGSTLIAFRTTIVDYGIDTNLEPSLNKYILEVLSFVDLAKIPAVLLLDSGLCYVETLLGVAHIFMALTIFLLTLTSKVMYVIVACLHSMFYAVSVACVGPALTTLGTSKMALSLGLSKGLMGFFLLGLPSLIGVSRDIYGTYDYVYYFFAVFNLILAILFGWTRKNLWFKNRK